MRLFGDEANEEHRNVHRTNLNGRSLAVDNVPELVEGLESIEGPETARGSETEEEPGPSGGASSEEVDS